MYRISKHDQFLAEKVKSLHKFSPAAITTAFSPNVVLDAKVHSSVFYNIPYLNLYFS